MTGSAVDDLQAAEDYIGTLEAELRRVARLVPVANPGGFCRCSFPDDDAEFDVGDRAYVRDGSTWDDGVTSWVVKSMERAPDTGAWVACLAGAGWFLESKLSRHDGRGWQPCAVEDCGCQCGQHRDEGEPEPEPWPVTDPGTSLVFKLGEGVGFDWDVVLAPIGVGNHVRLFLRDGDPEFAAYLGVDDDLTTIEVIYDDRDEQDGDDPTEPAEGLHSTHVRIDALAGIEVF